MEFIITLISDNFTISLILLVFIMSLFGEVIREIDDDVKVIPSKFISRWFKTLFGGVIVGLFLDFVNMPIQLILIASLCISYFGHTASDELLKKILNGIVTNALSSTKTQPKDNDNKK